MENPQIFTGERRLTRFQVFMKHMEYGLEYFGERYVVTTLRGFLPFYLKGIPDIRRIRNAAMVCKDPSALIDLLKDVE